MPRIRQSNITAVQWSPNGSALGSNDLTATGANVFGQKVFGPQEQRRRLPKDTYRTLQRTIEKGAELDPTIADAVAAAMKDWAMESGATHYTHWFQPLKIGRAHV